VRRKRERFCYIQLQYDKTLDYLQGRSHGGDWVETVPHPLLSKVIL